MSVRAYVCRQATSKTYLDLGGGIGGLHGGADKRDELALRSDVVSVRDARHVDVCVETSKRKQVHLVFKNADS